MPHSHTALSTCHWEKQIKARNKTSWHGEELLMATIWQLALFAFPKDLCVCANPVHKNLCCTYFSIEMSYSEPSGDMLYLQNTVPKCVN